jgi:hypothetical protein
MLTWGCLGSPTAPRLIGEGTPILFIGNSYLYAVDIPGILQALADSAGGERIATMTIAPPNYALIDHWHDGSTRQQVKSRHWSFVVLQQGWTPAGVCRDTLRLATQLFSTVMKDVGARPTLFEAWAPESRPGQFPGTIESYRIAAEDVNGLLLPIAEAWLAAATRDATVSLYSDGLHPNGAGGYLAAAVMYARFLNKSPVGLPPTVQTRSGVMVSLPPALAQMLQEVAADIGLTPTPVAVPVAPPVITSRC